MFAVGPCYSSRAAGRDNRLTDSTWPTDCSGGGWLSRRARPHSLPRQCPTRSHRHDRRGRSTRAPQEYIIHKKKKKKVTSPPRWWHVDNVPVKHTHAYTPVRCIFTSYRSNAIREYWEASSKDLSFKYLSEDI